MPAPEDGAATVTKPFLTQREEIAICHDLMGGTLAMRAAGEKYIPRGSGEDVKTWQARVNMTILFNIYKRTLRFLCGRVFEKQVALADDANERMLAFCEDVDHMGSNLTVWSRRAFEAGLNDGVMFCVVDFNAIKTREEDGRKQYLDASGQWADRTESAAALNGWGPYFIHVSADQVLDYRLEWHLGRPRVTHFRYIENCQKADGRWNIASYQRIRAYFLDENGVARWEVYVNDTEDQTAWRLDDEGVFSIGVLPVACFMPGEKRTDGTAEPALIDLAYLNVRYWQVSSAQSSLLEYMQRPAWFGKCLGEFDPESGKTKIIFGPGLLCHAEKEEADLRSVGVDAASVEAGRQALQDLKDDMAVYGLQLLQPKTGNITATESIRDSEENNSTLKAWALGFQDFLENCFRLAALWFNEPDGPGVIVNTEFANATDVQVLLDLYKSQVISATTLLNLIKGKGLLPDDFAVEEEAAKIANDLMANGLGATALADNFKAML